MLNELFKPGVIGCDLKEAVLQLMNGIKREMVVPSMMQLSNITTLYKNKGSRFDIENERGIFILTVLRKIFDKLIYNDKYQDIDQGMSDSNIGARRQKNIKNHLFVVYGIINSIINEEKSCIDICIYDLEKAFDALWLEDCLIDLYDTLPEEQHDDKLALVYEANRSNLVAVKTAVGLTERVNIEKVVTQGGTFGPIECANSIDKVGQKCYNKGEHLFVYKKMVRVLPLSMIDDLLTISRCGTASLALNTYVNAQIEAKKLRFHTPDENGKSKCHFLHIGKTNKVCPELQVHGTRMQRVTEDTYLGDIISEDGKNGKNIKNRISKGVGIISEIMNILETVSLGEHLFSTAVLLRESRFVNGILTNCEIWYGLNKEDINELESLDRTLLRNFFNTPFSTPIESLYLELGIVDMETTIKARRINYLYYLCTRKETEMLFEFFSTQWKYPTNKQDWTELVKGDLSDFGIPVDLDFIKSKTKFGFKNLVKIKSKEYAWKKFMSVKIDHSKMDNLWYSDLKMQDYLKSNKFTTEESRTIFSFRTRMANFGENFKNGSGNVNVPCPLCHIHLDTQAMAFQCPKLLTEVKIIGSYSDVFLEDIPKELVNTLTNILKFREKYLQERMIID